MCMCVCVCVGGGGGGGVLPSQISANKKNVVVHPEVT